MRRLQIIALFAVAVCLGTGVLPLRAQTSLERDLTTDEIQALIEKLQQGSFARRERAAYELKAAGLVSIEPLEELLKQGNLESRHRAASILEELYKLRRKRHLAAFVADASGRRGTSLPGWERFQKTVASGREGRKLFAQMHRAEPALLSDVEKLDPSRAAEAMWTRAAILNDDDLPESQNATFSTVAAVIFAANHPKLGDTNSSQSSIYYLCQNPYFQQALEAPRHGPLLKKLVANWVSLGRGGHYGIHLAIQFELPEGLDHALKLIKDQHVPVHIRRVSIVAVSALGSKENLKDLEPLLDDETVCYSQRPRETKICDMAMAVGIQLVDEDPEKFGFSSDEIDLQSLYRRQGVGFSSEAKRQAALKKWRAYLAKLRETEQATEQE